MQTATSAPPIERELHIDATPETVYGFFTDPVKMVRWMGRKAELDARPGGAVRIDYNGFDIMRGTFRELMPYTRIVFGWGWETLGDGPAPGESTVEVTLQPEDGGTRLRVVHSGLSAAYSELHAHGWDMLLPQLSAQAAGAPAATPEPALSPAEELASRLNSALVRLRYAIESGPSQRWAATTTEGWTVAATAHHVLDHLRLATAARAIADGQSNPLAKTTADGLAAANATAAQAFATAPPAELLAALLTEGPNAVEIVKQFTAEDLARTAALGVAGGALVPVEAIVAGPLVDNVEGHVASVEAALSGTNS